MATGSRARLPAFAHAKRPAMRLAMRIAVTTALLPLAGCATVATVQSITPTSARVFSGTGLDLRAMTGAPIPARLYKVAPPPYPWLDLPFSFMLDVLILPLTLGGGAVTVAN